MRTLEERLGQLQFEAFHGDLSSKTKKQLIDFAKEIATCAVDVLAHIDQVVDRRLDDKYQAQQLIIDNLRESMDGFIAENKQLKTEHQKDKNRSPNWGGKRANSGRHKTNIKRTSHKVNCSSREAAVLKEYGKKNAAGNPVNVISLWYAHEALSDFDVKVRYLYLSKDEWDIVKPEYQKYLEKIKK